VVADVAHPVELSPVTSINFLAGIVKRGCPTAPHFTVMKRKTANIDIRVEPQLVEKIDAWRATSEPVRGSRVPRA
jgi:hypothetical protein